MLDLPETAKSLSSERDRLQAIYDALPASRKKTPRRSSIATHRALTGAQKIVVCSSSTAASVIVTPNSMVQRIPSARWLGQV